MQLENISYRIEKLLKESTIGTIVEICDLNERDALSLRERLEGKYVIKETVSISSKSTELERYTLHFLAKHN